MTPPKTFLGEAPVPYPSYTDPDKDIGELLNATRGLPDTSFYDSEGRARLHQAGRPTRARPSCVADIRRYALSG